MEVFIHHIYEYEKGIRNLILHTLSKEKLEIAVNKLKTKNIDFIFYKLKNDRFNIFFGDSACINVIKK